MFIPNGTVLIVKGIPVIQRSVSPSLGMDFSMLLKIIPKDIVFQLNKVVLDWKRK
jgi:hypothetical protein